MASLDSTTPVQLRADDEGAADGGVDWQFSQCFGDREPEHFVDADTLTAVQFSYDGNHLATGDRGGRVVVFQRQEAPTAAAAEGPQGKGPQYRFFAEFQSHESEFDYLKSLEIEEKINHIAWCRGQASSVALLTTNDKTIKLWRISERRMKPVATVNVHRGRFGGQPPIQRLVVPSLGAVETNVVSKHRRTFNNAHAYHINSISTCSDGQTFLSADDLRINIWDFENTQSSFNVVDMKPTSMDELMEVITTAQFHPVQAHHFAFGSSLGTVRLADMRVSALCDDCGMKFTDFHTPQDKQSYGAMAASVNSVAFSPDGAFLCSRDYLSVKVWDVRKAGTPLHRVPVQEQLAPHLADMYESECIFDKFRIAPSADGRRFATGTYDDRLLVVDAVAGTEQTINLRSMQPISGLRRLGEGRAKWHPARTVDGMDFGRKLLHYTWHPTEDVLAVAGLSSLSLYTGSRPSAPKPSVPVTREASHTASIASSAGGSSASFVSDTHPAVPAERTSEGKTYSYGGDFFA